MEVTILTTADGSPTLYREDIDEHYHSVKGALAESQHIYVDLGWHEAVESPKTTTVFEVGFGTGLNAALTARSAEQANIPTIYYTIELYPLDAKTIGSLIAGLPEEIRGLLRRVNDAEWDRQVEISPFFTIVKIRGDILTYSIPQGIDAVYFDAFAPEKQPEIWDERLFEKIYQSMNPGGCLTTYCAKGAIRRMLNGIGFITERLPGPPAGKREVLRARKIII